MLYDCYKQQFQMVFIFPNIIIDGGEIIRLASCLCLSVETTGDTIVEYKRLWKLKLVK